MTNKTKLAEMLKKRNPFTPQREAVTPVDLYTKPQTVKATNRQESSKSIQVDKATKPQVVKTTNKQVGKPTNPLVVKTVSGKVEKYTTHLNHKTVKAIKRYALETDRKDYEVMQEAVGEYLKKRGLPIT